MVICYGNQRKLTQPPSPRETTDSSLEPPRCRPAVAKSVCPGQGSLATTRNYLKALQPQCVPNWVYPPHPHPQNTLPHLLFLQCSRFRTGTVNQGTEASIFSHHRLTPSPHLPHPINKTKQKLHYFEHTPSLLSRGLDGLKF